MGLVGNRRDRIIAAHAQLGELAGAARIIGVYLFIDFFDRAFAGDLHLVVDHVVERATLDCLEHAAEVLLLPLPLLFLLSIQLEGMSVQEVNHQLNHSSQKETHRQLT